MKWIIRIGIVTVGLPSLVIALLMLARFRPGRGHVTSDIDIHRPADVVFRWISEPERMEQWFGGIGEIARISPIRGAEASGDRFHAIELNKEQNSRTDLEMIVTDYVPSKQFGLEIRATGDSETNFTEFAQYRLTEDAGTTHVHFESQTLYRGKLPQVFEPFITAASRKKFQRDLTRLKALAEADSGNALKNSSSAHSAADAHRDHAVSLIPALELAQDRGSQFGARAPERMAKRNRAAVHVEARCVESCQLHDS